MASNWYSLVKNNPFSEKNKAKLRAFEGFATTLRLSGEPSFFLTRDISSFRFVVGKS